eukprot:TRINITY_DN3969_c0_g1_i1.p1 TRINITY_DN3969_c0_g1~~TRINITY_DN3969_c0_g1_i1.p1  ORF type:complete len:204 (+),score=88.95 TRINITY_DN3969_c0_g1_i1:787-1398(+)
MGDNGRLYVSEDMVPAFRKLVCHADIVTPNQFEAELLTGLTIASLDDAVKTCNHLHSLGPKRVILTSLELPESPGQLVILGSDTDAGVFSVTIPKLDCYFTGTGDMMAAVLLGWSGIEATLPKALEKAVSSVQGVIKVTQAYYTERLKEVRKKKGLAEEGGTEGLEKQTVLDARELRLVAGRHDVMSPKVLCTAVKVADPAER